MADGGSRAQILKQRALKVTWKPDGRPTELELLTAFRLVGAIVSVQIKDKCAAVLFASTKSVAAAVAAAAAAAPADESPWKNWEVQPMMGTTRAREEINNKGPDTGVAGHSYRDFVPFETPTNENKVLLAGGVVAVAEDSSRAFTVAQEFAEFPVGQTYVASGDENEKNMYMQKMSPLSSPEGFEIVTPLEKEGQGHKPGKKIIVERISGASPAGCSTHGGGGGGDISHPGTLRQNKETAQGTEERVLPPLSTEAATAQFVTSKQHEAATSRQRPPPPPTSHRDMEKLRVSAPAPAASSDSRVSQQENKHPDALLGDQTCIAVQKGSNVLGASSGDTGASEEKTKAREQAKRLALEVARLRSTLRVTTSELNTERSTRVRLEDEWWRKMREWEEDRGRLITSKQEVERVSRSAEEKIARHMTEDRAREAKDVSERAARDAAQHQAESAMNGVIKVQDRLIRALQAELEMITNARETAQENTREAKDQLRLYVEDFLHWRDRAKRLEAHLADPHHLHQRPELKVEAPPPWGSPPTQRQQQPEAFQQTDGGGAMASVAVESSLAAASTSADHAGITQTGNKNNDGEVAELSIPEKYARYFETTTGRYTAAPTRGGVALFGSPRIARGDRKGRSEAEAATAAAAWSTRSALAECSSSASSRVAFQRSMKTQQEVSARLERDLAKARADLQSIYAGSRTKHGGGCGDGNVMGIGLLRRKEGRSGEIMAEEVVTEADGDDDVGEGSDDDDKNPFNNPPGEDNAQVQNSTTHGGHSAGEFEQDKASGYIAPHIVEGSHMARVLAALLGADSTATATAMGRLSDAPPPSLRLTDYPPMLQAVFGEGPAVALPLLAPTTASERPVVMGSDRRQARSGETRLGGAGVLKKQQARSWSYGPVPADGRQKRWARESRDVKVHEEDGFGRGADKDAADELNMHPAATNMGSGACGGGRDADRWGEQNTSGGEAGVAPGVAEVSQSSSSTDAFRGYEAKSSLLQRWLAERVSPPLAHTTPGVT